MAARSSRPAPVQRRPRRLSGQGRHTLSVFATSPAHQRPHRPSAAIRTAADADGAVYGLDGRGVSAEALCEFTHKPLPRKRGKRNGRSSTIQARPCGRQIRMPATARQGTVSATTGGKIRPVSNSAKGPLKARIVTALLRDGNRVLLCHRSPRRRWYPDVWDLPGGHVEPIFSKVLADHRA